MKQFLTVLCVALLCSVASSQDKEIDSLRQKQVGSSAQIKPVLLERTFAVGLSLGSGYSFDLGFGAHSWNGDRHQAGWDLIASIWVPYFGKRDPSGTGVDTPFSWWTKTNVTEHIAGVSLGGRYFLGPVGVGLTLDIVRFERFQNWYSTASTTLWNTSAGDDTAVGIGVHGAIMASRRVCITVFYGKDRGAMVGLMYII